MCFCIQVKCNMALWNKLAAEPTAPKGQVCSRLVDEAVSNYIDLPTQWHSQGQFMSFPSILDLVKEICEKKVCYRI